MTLNFYINFRGKCREAFSFYEKHLGGKINSLTTFGELPYITDIDKKKKDEIAHGRIEIGGSILMGADVPHAEPMRSAYLTLVFDDTEKTDQIYELLSLGAEIFQQIQTVAFAQRYAMFRDRFGVSWMLLCQK